MSNKLMRPASERARDGRDFLIAKGHTDWAERFHKFVELYGFDIGNNCRCAVAATTGRLYSSMMSEWRLSRKESQELGFFPVCAYHLNDSRELEQAWRQLAAEALEASC